jgi:hypothetical protein
MVPIAILKSQFKVTVEPHWNKSLVLGGLLTELNCLLWVLGKKQQDDLHENEINDEATNPISAFYIAFCSIFFSRHSSPVDSRIFRWRPSAERPSLHWSSIQLEFWTLPIILQQLKLSRYRGKASIHHTSTSFGGPI